MSNKNNIEDGWVAMEHHQCPVCLKIHTFNCAVLLDKRMKKIKGNGPNGEVVTGPGLCEVHHKLQEEGWVALVEINEPPKNNSDKVEKADLDKIGRTGRFLHMRYTAVRDMLDIPEDMEVPIMALVDPAGFNMLLGNAESSTGGEVEDPIIH